MAFFATQHLFVRAIVEAGITFPASKESLIEQFGEVTYQEERGKEIPAADTVRELPLEYYHNGSEFWCAYSAYLAGKSSANGL